MKAKKTGQCVISQIAPFCLWACTVAGGESDFKTNFGSFASIVQFIYGDEDTVEFCVAQSAIT